MNNTVLSARPGIQAITMCLALSLITTCYAWWCLLNHDAASYLAFGELVWRGKVMYRDFFEINTPLIVYVSLIPVALHHLTGLPVIPLFFAFVFFLTHICIWVAWQIAQKLPIIQTQRERNFVLFLLYYTGFILPNFTMDFGQRQHLFILFSLPYTMLALAYSYGLAVPLKWRVVVGIMAGIGFSIKPQFIILFAAAELFYLFSRRRLPAVFKTENFIIGGMFLAYHAWLVTAFPEYLSVMVPHFMANYAGYQTSLAFVLFLTALCMSPTLIFLFFGRSTQYHRPALLLMMVLALTASLLFIVPLTVYKYHFMPMLVFQLLAGAILLIRRSVYVWLVLFLYPLWLPAYFTSPDMEQRQHNLRLIEAIRTHAEGEPVAFLSASVDPAFPAINYAGATWALAMPYMMQLPAPYMSARSTGKEPTYHTLERMGKTERFFTERTLDDLETLPRLIVIDNRLVKQGFPQMKFDMLNYFMMQARFRKVWQHYEHVEDIYDFAIYKRTR